MIDNIGKMAGNVWGHLNSNGSMSVAKLKTALKVDAIILNASIGWLAREDKIQRGKVGNSIIVSLK